MIQRFYTGIGSRATPPEVLATMETVARRMMRDGWTLRSGGAAGADSAFEKGAGCMKEIWLPWHRFRNHQSILVPTDAALEMAAAVHENWQACTPAAKKLHARNVHQVLGADLKTPSLKLICWTLGGAEIGGTRTAIKIAQIWGIEIQNLGTSQ